MSSATSVEAKNAEAICSSQRAHSRSGHSTSSFLPASTRCIMIAELRWNIFDLVAPPNIPVGTALETWIPLDTKKTLLALALTCKSFTEPALDLLWRHLGGFEPLIKCLPRSLWKQSWKKLEFQRTMTLDDWSIFCKYNHRVRSLFNECHERYSKDAICSTKIWRALSRPPFSLPLLPNLTSLTWANASDKTFQYVQLFVTPKLTMLHLSTAYYGRFTFGPSKESIFSSIAKSCPSVSDLGFDFGRNRAEYTVSVGDTSTMLRLWSHLTSVRTGTISEATILHLSKLPSLRVLKFTLPSTSISTDAQKLLQRPVFCALQELDVTFNSLVILDAFLEKLTITPKVLSFTITGGVGSERALPGLISRLSDVCAHSSLQEVRLSITGQPAYYNASIEAAAFQPLYAFRNLRKLDFEPDAFCIVQIDDASLLQMAKAWPYLEELRISKYPSRYQVTAHAFVVLLRYCPRLRSVTVPIDWSTIDVHTIPPDIPYQGFSQKALSNLFVGGSSITRPTSIAAFISAVAPNLRSITGTDSSWKTVQNLLETLPMVREQGRRMMLNEIKRGYYGVDGNVC
ncbi:hypothetical protein F4604DRAFT_1933846 [Suillus subluteus]|nr:hypothetical protein F4604DRAFT_1933846 [Suillus subluteus]